MGNWDTASTITKVAGLATLAMPFGWGALALAGGTGFLSSLFGSKAKEEELEEIKDNLGEAKDKYENMVDASIRKEKTAKQSSIDNLLMQTRSADTESSIANLGKFRSSIGERNQKISADAGMQQASFRAEAQNIGRQMEDVEDNIGDIKSGAIWKGVGNAAINMAATYVAGKASEALKGGKEGKEVVDEVVDEAADEVVGETVKGTTDNIIEKTATDFGITDWTKAGKITKYVAPGAAAIATEDLITSIRKPTNKTSSPTEVEADPVRTKTSGGLREYADAVVTDPFIDDDIFTDYRDYNNNLFG